VKLESLRNEVSRLAIEAGCQEEKAGGELRPHAIEDSKPALCGKDSDPPIEERGLGAFHVVGSGYT